MNNVMEYKGYIGSIEYSEPDNILYGKVQGIRSLISYEGESISELVSDFHEAVDDYLKSRKERGIEPEVAYKGMFNVRIPSELHKKLAIKASQESKTLNQCVTEILQQAMM